MSSTRIPSKLLLFAALFLLPQPSSAQAPVTGLPTFGSFDQTKFGTINLENLNVSLGFPIVSSPGRSLPLNSSMLYNSSVWVGQTNVSWGPAQADLSWGWNFLSFAQSVHFSADDVTCRTGPNTSQGSTHFNGFSFVDSNGTPHPFPLDFYYPATQCNFRSGPTSAFATDGSGYYLAIPSAGNLDITVYAPSGTRLHNGTLEDSNGNIVGTGVIGGIQDGIGRVALKITNSIDHLTVTYQVLDTNGNYQTTTVKQQLLNIKSAFGCSSQGEYTGSAYLPTEIDLPNGLKYTITYEPTPGAPTFITARVKRVNLPTGGYQEYDYPGPHDGMECATGTTVALTRIISDGTNTSTWQYSRLLTTNPVGSQTTVTDPQLPYDSAANQRLFTFTYPTGASNLTGAKETSHRIYQGSVASGKLLQTVNTTWLSVPGPQLQGPGTITTILDNNQQSKTVYTYDNYGNILTKSEYDWGVGTPGSLLRTTTSTYLSTSAYVTANILDRVATRIVTNGAGVAQARTVYSYDSAVPFTGASCITGAAAHDDTTFGCSNVTRGNPTTITTYTDAATPGGPVIQNLAYDSLGNKISQSGNCCEQDQWTYSAATQYSMPDSAVRGPSSGPQLTINFTYNPYTSARLTDTAPNSQQTTYSYDVYRRLVQTSLPDGGHTTYCYTDVGGPTCTLTSTPLETVTTKGINGSMSLTSTAKYDGLGRTSQLQTNSDPQGVVLVDTTYDALGRSGSVSNPYRAGSDATSSPGTTTYSYDALGRKIHETYPDGLVLTTAYCGASTLVTDPTGKWRRSRTDGLGRLVEMDEANAPGATVTATGCPGTGEPIWITTYSYDSLGNLTQVLQNGSHQRSFTYDSLSHLLTSTNPEVGTITYTYDTNGNVATKKDARSVTTTYGYDALNRETSRTYSNGDPTITTHYDETNCLGLSACQNIGHRTSMTDGAGSESWAYQIDAANSRSIHKEQRTTNSVAKSTTYVLDLAGNTTQITYPTGRIVNYTYDAASRPSTATDSSNGITYATDFQSVPSGCLAGKVCYTPQGTFYALSIGQSSSFTGLNLTHTYNSRLQPNEFKAASSAGNAIDISYNFVDPITTKNAGHVYAITNNLDITRSQIFTYDQLNRITGAQTASTFATSPTHCWGEVYTLDAWANLTQISATTNSAYTGCSQESGFTKIADANNHFTDFSYDLSGNTQNDGVNAYTWNAESQMKTANGVTAATYLYDGDGRRVAKANTATPPVPYKLYWYGSGGEILAETDASGNTQNEYIFFGGQRIAILPAGSSPNYYVEDLLGTSRVITQSNGAVCYDADFYPFGGERTPYTNTCPQNYKFEGKERDTETGNDDFGARYYSNRFGRWLSADWSSIPAPVPYANLTNPQTLNLYAMVSDDPESFADLDGHYDFPGIEVPGIGGSDPSGLWGCGSKPTLCEGQGNDKKDDKKKDPPAAEYDPSNTERFYTDPGTGLMIDLGDPKKNLDVAAIMLIPISMVPGVGVMVAPAFSAISITEGDNKGAALNMAMATPLGGIGKLGKLAEESVSVYEKTETAYVGISNGLARRGIEHGEQLKEVASGLSRTQARGVEQAIIEQKGLAKNGGTLTNKINSIAKTNPIYKEAVAFGIKLLKSLVL